MVLGQEGDDPSEELSFVGVVEVVIIVIGVGVALGRLGDVCDVGHCPDLACGFIKEDPPCVLDHQLPVDLVEPFSQLG